MMGGPRLMALTLLLLLLLGLFFRFGPTPFSDASVEFSSSPKTGQHLVVESVANRIFVLLLVALVILAVYRSRRRTTQNR